MGCGGKGTDCGKIRQQLVGRRSALKTVRIFFGDKIGGDIAFAEPLVLHQRREEIDIVAGALDLEPVERVDLAVNRLDAGLTISDQLGDHRIVEDRNLAAFGYAIVNANAFFGFGRTIFDQTTGGRQEAAIGVFRIDATFDRPAC